MPEIDEIKSNSNLPRRVVPAVIIGVALVAVYITTSFAEMPPILKRGIQPADFPRLVAIAIIFLTCLMAWRDPIKDHEPVPLATWKTIGLMIGFVLLLPLDMFLALGFFGAALMWLWGEKRPQRLAAIGLAAPAALFFVFDLAFRIRFPRGLLTNLWYG